MLKKIAIVTGASGFVGNATVNELLNNGYTVYAVIRDKSKFKFSNYDRCIPVVCDLSEIDKLGKFVSNKDISYFYNFAWGGTSGEKRADPNIQLDNVKFTIECLKVAKKIGCSRFINAGSIMEIETIKAAFSQGNKPGLGYIYGSAKLVSHTMCKSVAASLGIDLIWPMITNAYGVGEVSARLVNTTIQKCIRGENPQFTAATQNYDFVYIDDVARAFRLIAEEGHPFSDYLIGSSNAKPLKQFLLEMKNEVAPTIDFLFGNVPFTGVNLELSDFDCSLTEKDTGFKANISFAEGCRKTYDWWTKRIQNASEI